MKKIIKPIAIFLAFSMTAVSCQKEITTIPTTGNAITNTETMVYYTSNGESGSTNLPDDDAWDAFLDRMMALAREGNSVSFSGHQVTGQSLSKESVVYTTTSEDDAKRWSKEMVLQGYEVTVDYDKTTGIYTCIAVK